MLNRNFREFHYHKTKIFKFTDEMQQKCSYFVHIKHYSLRHEKNQHRIKILHWNIVITVFINKNYNSLCTWTPTADAVIQ